VVVGDLAGAGEEVAEEEEPDDSTLKDALERGAKDVGSRRPGFAGQPFGRFPQPFSASLKWHTMSDLTGKFTDFLKKISSSPVCQASPPKLGQPDSGDEIRKRGT